MILEILNPKGENLNGLCEPLLNGTQEKYQHVQKEKLAEDVQKLPILYNQLQFMDQKY